MAAPLGNNNHLKHGGTGTRLYNIWKSMRQRCTNPNNNRYKSYGAKGISVCNEWDNYENFESWALSHGYSEELTIDRIDNDKDYEPNNCRWSTYKEQERHRTNNVLYEYNEQLFTLAELAEIFAIPYKTLYARIHYRKWSLDKALKT